LSDCAQHAQQHDRFIGCTPTGCRVDLIRVVRHVDEISGKKNDGSARPLDPATYSELVAAEFWQATIRDDGLKVSSPHLICSRYTITGRFHGISFLLQLGLQEGSATSILVND
jgi:hypothetical protein